MSKKISGLYGISIDGSNNLLSEVEQALQGGAKVIQYRDKSIDKTLRLTQARELKALCDEYSACFIINDDLELALTIDADGLHVGKNDGDISKVRSQLGNKILGVSCYNSLDLAQNAQKKGADYVAFGRFYTSITKPNAVPADLSLIQQAKESINLPIVAIGGITLNNASPLIAAGVDSVAVIDGLFRQKDIKQTAEKFTKLFTNS